MEISNILVILLVGLVWGIIGYLIGKMNSKKDDLLAAALQDDLDACKAHNKNLNAKVSSLEADLVAKVNNIKSHSFVSSEPSVVFDAKIANAVLDKNVEEDDLKIIEGIGPKIESLFKSTGISTWKKLSEASAEEIQSILEAGGENYAIHNPITWTKQALLAYEGKWQDLKDLQENLQGGKE